MRADASIDLMATDADLPRLRDAVVSTLIIDLRARASKVREHVVRLEAERRALLKAE